MRATNGQQANTRHARDRGKDVPRYKHARVVWHPGLNGWRSIDGALSYYRRGRVRIDVGICPLFLRYAVRRVAVARLDDIGGVGGVAGVWGDVVTGGDESTSGWCLDEGVVAGAPGATGRRGGHLGGTAMIEDGSRRQERRLVDF